MMFDAHDTQAINTLIWLNPTNVEFPQPTVYATEISAELLISEECLERSYLDEAQKRAECFHIQMLYNGKVLEFDGTCKKPGKCSYTEFRDFIDSIWCKNCPKIEDDISIYRWSELCEIDKTAEGGSQSLEDDL